jgi:chromosome segregation ATPase
MEISGLESKINNEKDDKRKKELESELKQKRDLLKNIKDAISNLNREKNRLDSDKRVREKEINTSADKVKTKLDEQSKLNSEYSELQNSKTTRKDNIEKGEEDMRGLLKEKEKKVNELRINTEKLSELNENLSNKTAKLASDAEKLNVLEADQSAKNNVDAVKSDIESNKKQIAELELQSSNLNHSKETLSNNLNTSKEQQSKLDSEVNERKNKIEGISKDIETKSQEIEDVGFDLKQKASIYSSKRDSAMKVRKDIAECRENIGIIDAKKSQQNLASKSNIKKTV